MKTELPMGWKVALPAGIELDNGTPEDEWDTISNPRHPRDELFRWVRGNRYVRICEEIKEDTEWKYALHYGLLDINDDIIKEWNDSLDEMMVSAKVLMRIGGY